MGVHVQNTCFIEFVLATRVGATPEKKIYIMMHGVQL